MRRFFILFYLFLLLLHLFAGYSGAPAVAFSTKPLLLTSLIAFFIWQTRHMPSGKFRNLILTGLIFSLMGDVFLMFQIHGSHWFIAGLSSFFLAHVMYIWAFTKVYLDNQQVELIKRHGWVMILIFAYGFFFFRQLQGHLGAMTGPVIVYVIVISLMLLIASNRYGRVGERSFWLIFSGALLFVASDSILAWNKFVHPLMASHVLIMGTYGLAQLLITLGALRQVEEVALRVRE